MAVDSRVPELQKSLEDIIKRVKILKKKKSEIMIAYVESKNRLMGAVCLHGEEFVRSLGRPESKEQFPRSLYREDYFESIKYMSKLRKIRDKISSLEERYNSTLFDLRSLVDASL